MFSRDIRTRCFYEDWREAPTGWDDYITNIYLRLCVLQDEYVEVVWNILAGDRTTNEDYDAELEVRVEHYRGFHGIFASSLVMRFRLEKN